MASILFTIVPAFLTFAVASWGTGSSHNAAPPQTCPNC
jgi:hypothetical protein